MAAQRMTTKAPQAEPTRDNTKVRMPYDRADFDGKPLDEQWSMLWANDAARRTGGAA